MSSNYSIFCDVGIVTSVSDDIVIVRGMSDVCFGEMVIFCNTNSKGLVLNLQEDEVGVIVLGNDINIFPGDYVSRTKVLLSIPVGDCLLGRVVDPLGNFIDSLDFSFKSPIFDNLDIDDSIFFKRYNRFIESRAPSIISRTFVDTPLETGLKVIDSMVPIGHGQRELI